MDDVVLLAPSACDLQLSLDRFAAECKAAGMKISTSKSEAMVLNREKFGLPVSGRGREPASLVRCLGHVPPVGAPREDPGHTKETMSPSLPGNASGSPWKSWRRGKSGLLCLGCFPCDPTPNSGGEWMDESMEVSSIDSSPQGLRKKFSKNQNKKVATLIG